MRSMTQQRPVPHVVVIWDWVENALPKDLTEASAYGPTNGTAEAPPPEPPMPAPTPPQNVSNATWPTSFQSMPAPPPPPLPPPPLPPPPPGCIICQMRFHGAWP